MFSSIKSSRYSAELLCESLPGGLYDWTEKLPLWNIARVFLAANYNSRKQGFLDEKRFMEEMPIMLFIVRYNIKLTPTFQNLITQNLMSKKKLKMLVEFENSGKSSITVATTMRDFASNDILGMASEKLVLVDCSTRRPAILPSWFQDSYGSMRKPNSNAFLQRNLSSTVPRNAFNVKLITRYSDLDINGHVTTPVYFQYFLECLSEASRSGYFNDLSHPLSYIIEEIDISFIAECRAREEITVFVWQGIQNHISFAIYLREKELVNGVALFRKEVLRNELESDTIESKL